MKAVIFLFRFSAVTSLLSIIKMTKEFSGVLLSNTNERKSEPVTPIGNFLQGITKRKDAYKTHAHKRCTKLDENKNQLYNSCSSAYHATHEIAKRKTYIKDKLKIYSNIRLQKSLSLILIVCSSYSYTSIHTLGPPHPHPHYTQTAKHWNA